MIFQCEYGHQWETQAKRVKSGTWCPVCVKRNPQQSEVELHQIVTSKGGKLLSNYVNSRTKVEVECYFGHRWLASSNHLKSHNSWYLICSTGSYKAEQGFYQIIVAKGGKVHQEYINNHNKVEVECAFRHRWWTQPKDILQGKWCRNCAFRMDVCEQEFRDAVTSKSGIVVGEYIDTYTNVLVKCQFGHKWMANTSWIRRGTWCTQCNQSRGEREVSEALIKLGIQFNTECKHHLLPTKRYDFYFLYNGIHYLLEFDGVQHFEWNTLYHKSEEDLEKSHNIDRLKTYVALSVGYRMIRIDYTQLGRIYECILYAIQSLSQLFVTSIQMYSWLVGSTVPIQIIQKECPSLLTV